MHIKLISLLLALSLIHLSALPSRAETDLEKQTRHAAKVKQSVYKLGVGKDARIAVILRDKSRLVGYVSEVGENSFVVTHPKTGASTVVAYPNVAQVKGNNLSTGAKIAIVAGIVAAIVLLIILKKYCDNEGGC